MEWLLSSLNLNLIENLWPIVKMTLYEGGKQYNSKVDIYKAIKATKSKTEPAEIKNLTKSMGNRLL